MDIQQLTLQIDKLAEISLLMPYKKPRLRNILRYRQQHSRPSITQCVDASLLRSADHILAQHIMERYQICAD